MRDKNTSIWAKSVFKHNAQKKFHILSILWRQVSRALKIYSVVVHVCVDVYVGYRLLYIIISINLYFVTCFILKGRKNIRLVWSLALHTILSHLTAEESFRTLSWEVQTTNREEPASHISTHLSLLEASGSSTKNKPWMFLARSRVCCAT